MPIRLLQGDCLQIMPTLAPASIDLILCDLPYGTTACKWDSIIPLDALWREYAKLARGAIVLTAAQPFTSALVMSNLSLFRYSLVWDKVNKYTGALNSKKMPLRRHEDICVFYKKLPTYNPQWRKGKAFQNTRTGGHGEHTQYGKRPFEKRFHSNDGEHHNPCSIIEIPSKLNLEMGQHPTQKPVALMEYLIKTYTNPGDTVLDNCMGSGTTGVACVNTGREFIGIEQDPNYFQIASTRIAIAEYEKACR